MPRLLNCRHELAALDPVAHELRRALMRPVCRLWRGEIARCQQAAIARGWLAPAPAAADACHLLVATPAGRAYARLAPR